MSTLHVAVTIGLRPETHDLVLPYSPRERGDITFEVRSVAGHELVLRHKHDCLSYLVALWAAHVVDETGYHISWTDPERVLITNTTTGETVEAEVETDMLG